jgi:hypothetical protein
MVITTANGGLTARQDSEGYTITDASGESNQQATVKDDAGSADLLAGGFGDLDTETVVLAVAAVAVLWVVMR